MMPSSDWNKLAIKDYEFNRFIVGRQLKFTLIPRQCYITKHILWLENAYCITAMYTGPGTPAYVHRWYDKDAYLLARLKDLI